MMIIFTQSRKYRCVNFTLFMLSVYLKIQKKEKTSAKESFPSDKRTAHDKDRVYASDGGHGDAPRAVRTLLKCRVCALLEEDFISKYCSFM